VKLTNNLQSTENIAVKLHVSFFWQQMGQKKRKHSTHFSCFSATRAVVRNPPNATSIPTKRLAKSERKKTVKKHSKTSSFYLLATDTICEERKNNKKGYK